MSVTLATKGVIRTGGGPGGGYEAIPVCDPDLIADEVGITFIDVDDLDVTPIEPAPGQELLPNKIEVAEVLPRLNTFPLPTNL